MKAQSLVEYALIIVLVAVVLIVVLAVLSPLFNSSCGIGHTQFDCSDSKVQECLKSEQYTKDQCVILIGGTK